MVKKIISMPKTKKTSTSNKTHRKILYIIMDGWGLGKDYEGNAITRAKTPNFKKFWEKYPHASLAASGEAVGLPEGQMGSSEVNHMVIGSGRVAFQDLVKINRDIKNQKFSENPAFVKTFEFVKKNNSTLHLKGLVSPGGVHSHQEHLFALIKAAKAYGLKKIYIHVFTDGRDTGERSAKEYISTLENFLKKEGIGQIASIAGRYYAMDRDHNWDRTDLAFEMLVNGKIAKHYKSALEAIEDSYQQGITDEYIKPARIELQAGEEGNISSNDAVIFINFRNDRTRQLVERFLEKGPKNLQYTTMTQYNPDYHVDIAYPIDSYENTLGEILSKNNIKQLRITETEKFAHLTFFFNCKREEAYEGEDRLMIDSYSDIKTHDERPEMRTADIVKQINLYMENKTYDCIITNICNCDMVGHSGKIKPVMKAVEIVDQAIGDLVKVASANAYDVIISADHGNAEELINETDGTAVTSHTTNPVPFILISKKFKKFTREEGGLADVAPTLLKMLNLKVPKEMNGKSLI